MARWKKRPTADHRLRADDCRRRPGVWIEIGAYRSGQSATSTARRIRTADRLPYYSPAGAYETRTTPQPNGDTTVYARFIGATS